MERDIDIVTFGDLQYLSDERKKKRAQESKNLLSQIQVMFEEDKGWEDEDSMLADMAAFRRERMV